MDNLDSSSERLLEWVEKANSVKQKYDSNRQIIISGLISFQPRWYKNYNGKRALVLLYLLYKIVQQQQKLAVRFVEGSSSFLSNAYNTMGTAAYESLFPMKQEGEKLSSLVTQELAILENLSSDFSYLNEHVSLKSIEGNIFSSVLNTSGLNAILVQVQDLSFSLPDVDKIKTAHTLFLSVYYTELAQKEQVSHRLQKVKSDVLPILQAIEMGVTLQYVTIIKNGTVRKWSLGLLGVAIVAYFSGAIDYTAFNELRRIAKRGLAMQDIANG